MKDGWGLVCVGLLCVGAGRGQAAAIHNAVRENDILAVEKILTESDGTAVHSALGGGITPLHLAAVLDHKAIAGLLICSGAKPDGANEAGFTPLHWAASKDSAGTAELLIKFGASVNSQARNGITPLHYAASKNATNMIVRLLFAGARVDAETQTGLAPLHWALMNDAHEAAVLIAYHATTLQMETEKNELENLAAEIIDKAELEANAEPDSDSESAAEPDVAVEPEPGEAGETAVDEMIAIEGGSLDHDLTEREPARPSGFPRPAYGKSLLVPIGFNEKLEFIWIEDMQLWVGKYEVTNAQYRRSKPKHKSLFREDLSLEGKTQPVVHVSWNDAKVFCRWLNLEYGDRLPLQCEIRLPSSKEWMTFSASGQKRTYAWGEKWPPAFGNLCDLTARRTLRTKSDGVKYYDDGYAVSCSVEESGANDWGVYGVVGNVWEWCEDWYNDTSEHKVRHGGSWDSDGKEALRLNRRGFDRPDTRDDTIGFRLVVSRIE